MAYIYTIVNNITDASVMERVTAAAQGVVHARAELDAAVASARAHGGSWEAIGAALRHAGLRAGDVLRAMH